MADACVRACVRERVAAFCARHTPQTYGGWCRHQPPLPWVRSPSRNLALFPGRIRFRPRSCDLGPDPSRVSRPKPCGLGLGPQRESHQSKLRWDPFRGSFARRLRFRWTSLESGSGIDPKAFASRFFLRSPCHSLRRLSPLRMSAAFRGGNVRELTSFRTCVLPVGRSWPHLVIGRAIRVARVKSACG
jgi:hypothetical protein